MLQARDNRQPCDCESTDVTPVIAMQEPARSSPDGAKPDPRFDGDGFASTRNARADRSCNDLHLTGRCGVMAAR